MPSSTIPGNTLSELMEVHTNESPFNSRKINSFYVLPKTSKKYNDNLIKDQFGWWHIQTMVPMLPVLKTLLKAEKVFIVEPIDYYGVTINGTSILIDTFDYCDVQLQKNQITQIDVAPPSSQITYTITQILLPNTEEKATILAMLLSSELRGAWGFHSETKLEAEISALFEAI